jgi:predicted SAM-dependent methyltransferase
MNKYNYLNLGCGSRYHPDWINIDIVPSPPYVRGYDLRKGIPLDNTSVDVVYHSNILEHLKKDTALSFLKECHRVLKPGGTIRIATPDLERLCKDYLEELAKAAEGNPKSQSNHEWLMIELLDQIVRTQSGGEMAEYLSRKTLINEDFIYQRIGVEGKLIRQYFNSQPQATVSTPTHSNKPKNKLSDYFNRQYWKRYILKRLLGGEMALLEQARFRNQGEVHYWLYDRYSLSELLIKAGFHTTIIRNPFSSNVSNWVSFGLEITPEGEVFKPDSIYMEAQK